MQGVERVFCAVAHGEWQGRCSGRWARAAAAKLREVM